MGTTFGVARTLGKETEKCISLQKLVKPIGIRACITSTIIIVFLLQPELYFTWRATVRRVRKNENSFCDWR